MVLSHLPEWFDKATLYPHTFSLYAPRPEAMSSLLQKEAMEGGIIVVPITRGGTNIHHLFFADDSLLFYRANTIEWGRIQAILNLYEAASGQKVSREKTSVFFSRNTKDEIRQNILLAIGVSATNRYEKYWDFPLWSTDLRWVLSTVSKARFGQNSTGGKKNFSRMRAKKSFSRPAVIQVIPTYTMSVFQLQKTLSRELNTMMEKFWWGHKDNDNKIAWMRWDWMGKTKERGGLGYREPECFNKALLAKVGWRFHQEPDSLVAKTYREKYYPGGVFMESFLGKRPSYAWSCMEEHLECKTPPWRRPHMEGWWWHKNKYLEWQMDTVNINTQIPSS
jgi:hypothetical protein